MELKNMTNEGLLSLMGKINDELANRKKNKCEEYRQTLIDIIEKITNNDYKIRLFGYSEEYGHDTEIILTDYYNYDIYVE